MYKIKEAIIVEGVYDKSRLAGFIDGVIITTHGFAVYNNPDFVETIKKLADTVGIVILTDSDSAGLRIRNFIKQKVDKSRVKHAYVPDIEGVERRKRKPSAEGLLGVEGMSEDIIIKALRDAGCQIQERGVQEEHKDETERIPLTKADLYEMGLTGGANSRALRGKLAAALGIPAKLSANMLLDVINRVSTKEEVMSIIGET